MGTVHPIDRARRQEAPENASLPPANDLESEAALLACAILEPGGTDERAKAQRARLDRAHELVAASSFYSRANGLIWAAIKQVRAASSPVGIDTVALALRRAGELEAAGGLARLGELWVNDETTVEELAERVHNCARLRALADVCLRIQAGTRGPIADAEKWIAGVRAELGKATAPRARLIGAHASVVANEAREYADRAINGAEKPITWGIGQLNHVFGALARKRHHLLVAEPEHGKTVLAFQCALGIASQPPDEYEMGTAVYFKTAEMPRRELFLRAACGHAGINMVRFGPGLSTSEQERIRQWLDHFGKLPIVVDDSETPSTPEELASRIEAHKETFARGQARDAKNELLAKARLSVVFGDHLLDLAEHPPAGAGRDELSRIKAVNRAWQKKIAEGCDVATVLLHHLHSPRLRKFYKPAKSGIDWPRVEDLMYRSAATVGPDRILAICQPQLSMRDCPSRWRGVLAAMSLKGRFGGSRAKCLLGFYPEGFIGELPPEARLHEEEMLEE